MRRRVPNVLLHAQVILFIVIYVTAAQNGDHEDGRKTTEGGKWISKKMLVTVSKNSNGNGAKICQTKLNRI